ncbi:hypothetical protein [Kordiimonas aquimaris]|uniref:hypothetical protein n=1 Tax=Kordiimonas aquimaris TaxID=707591 RepID=UPI0021CDF1C5|nr:hypothetical protein [Kordiimonas aquimaris]
MNSVSAFKSASKGKPKKPAPFSLRLTEKEKNKLLHRAKGQPLGGYIKGQLFNVKNASITKTDAATVLAILGSSDLARNMACIAKAAEIGAMPVTPELAAQLQEACTDIDRMRFALVRSLGLKPK